MSDRTPRFEGIETRRDAVLWGSSAENGLRWLRLIQRKRLEDFEWKFFQMEFLTRLFGSEWRAPRLQPHAGGYCRGTHIEECRIPFGDRLADICASCPD